MAQNSINPLATAARSGRLDVSPALMAPSPTRAARRAANNSVIQQESRTQRRYLTYAEKHALPIKTPKYGAVLLNDPHLNKGAAFSRDERDAFGLTALLPHECHPIEVQTQRAYRQFQRAPTKLAQYAFLQSLRDQNRVLYFRLLQEHLKETTVERFSDEFRRPGGLFLSFTDREHMHEQIEALGGADDIDLVVVTDSEGILGIGDQGTGGILITVGKATLYTLGAGIDPSRILCICLDAGTNNEALLNDPLYLGWRRPRVTGKDYDEFLDDFVRLASERFPHALIHFEDFGVSNASRLLEKFQETACVFNDDIQATGAVSVAAAMSACRVTQSRLSDQRIVIYGAGTAGCGIAAALANNMAEADGTPIEEAHRKLWLIDRNGLLVDSMENLRNVQKPFAREADEVKGWSQSGENGFDLSQVIKQVRPTILIGTSGQGRAFKEEMLREMVKHVDRPIVMPLSNPTRLCEADPADINAWTDGKALIATGSPFPPCKDPHSDKEYIVAECNNALIFPGLGLGTVLSRAKHLTNSMISAGIVALSKRSPALNDPDKALLPDITSMRSVSYDVAAAVMEAALDEGTATAKYTKEEIPLIVKSQTWDPVYRPLEYTRELSPK